MSSPTKEPEPNGIYCCMIVVMMVGVVVGLLTMPLIIGLWRWALG